MIQEGWSEMPEYMNVNSNKCYLHKIILVIMMIMSVRLHKNEQINIFENKSMWLEE
jgi:hypothetical protein